MKPREAIWAPERAPVKLRCPSKVVFGHLYGGAGEGVVLEVVCRAKGCRKDGVRTVHLFDALGECLTRYAVEGTPGRRPEVEQGP